MSISQSGSVARVFQKIAQDDRRGGVVDGNFPAAFAASRRTAPRRPPGVHAGNSLLGFPRAQALIHQLDWNSNRFFHTRGKTLHFFRHLARHPIQMQRQPHHNSAHHLLPHQFMQARQVAPAVDPRPGGERPRSNSQLVGKCQPQPFFSVVNRQDYTRGA